MSFSFRKGLLAAFVFVTLSSPAYALTDRIYKELATFSKILDLVDQYYVTPIDEKKLVQGAISGMLASLDPHTLYLPADVYRDFSIGTKGRFGGIGIEVTIKDGVLTVVSPVDDSPAMRAGIRPGDKILFINGKSTKGSNLNDAVHLMRGPIGHKINMVIWHAGHTRNVSLSREVIQVESVKAENLGNGLGYLRIATFQENTSDSLKGALDKLTSDNGGKLKGIVLDLRDDPGGLLSEAVRVVDLFVDHGVIVSTRGRDKVVEVKHAQKEGTLPRFPIVVMINGGSASASEIVAGALQDLKRAKLVGTKSYGKGSVQTVIDMEGGAALKITVARYYTPSNRMIDGKGIQPDILLNKKLYRRKLGLPADSFKNKKQKLSDDQTKKLTREEYEAWQKAEAIKILKR